MSFIFTFRLKLRLAEGQLKASSHHLFLHPQASRITCAAQSIIVEEEAKDIKQLLVPVFLFHNCNFSCSQPPELNIDALLKVHIRHALV